VAPVARAAGAFPYLLAEARHGALSRPEWEIGGGADKADHEVRKTLRPPLGDLHPISPV